MLVCTCEVVESLTLVYRGFTCRAIYSEFVVCTFDVLYWLDHPPRCLMSSVKSMRMCFVYDTFRSVVNLAKTSRFFVFL